MAKRSFQALDGSEIRSILLKSLENKLADAEHPALTKEIKCHILASAKKNLDLDERFGFHLTYPVITLDVLAMIWADDPAPFPWAVRFDMTTPQNLPIEWNVEIRGTSAVPAPPKDAKIQVQPPAPEKQGPAPLKHPGELVARKEREPAILETGMTDDLRDRRVRTETVHGHELETGSEASPFGPGEAPPEDRAAIAEEQRMLEQRNAKILAEAQRKESGAIVLTDRVDEAAPDAVRRANGLQVPKTKVVAISGGVRESTLRQTVDRAFDEGVGAQPEAGPAAEVEESL